MITALYRLVDLLCLLGRRRPAAPTNDSLGQTRQARPACTCRRSGSRRATYLRAVTGDAGMTTAEYAVGTVAAVAFAVVLFKVVQSPAVHSALAAIVTGALHVRM